MKIILASASPRRRELLGQIGIGFEVRVSSADENVTGREPWQTVEELSCRKAEAVLKMLGDEAEDMLVIGADTVVAAEGRILGKPSGSEEAAEMLRMLAGNSHMVYTGVTLLYRTQDGRDEVRRRTFHEATKVMVCPMTEEEIQFYVSSGECMDKAGAYGIQGLFARYVSGIEGDYNNVVGLPVSRLYQETKDFLPAEAGWRLT